MAQIVRDVMSANLNTVGVKDSLIDASKAMREHDIGDVIIVQVERLLGILTDTDIVVRGLAEGKSPNAHASEIATTEVKVLSPTTTPPRRCAGGERPPSAGYRSSKLTGRDREHRRPRGHA